LLILILSLSLVVSHGNYYNMGGGFDDEFHVSEYKYYKKAHFVEKSFDGWTRKKKKFDDDWKRKDENWFDDDDWRFRKKAPREKTYYKYVPHMREWERFDCYDYAPRNQLFYFKCP
jgi:hypothetical protein